MIKEQENQITEMRISGLGFTAIASRLGLSRIAIRAFCKAHDLMGMNPSASKMPKPTPGRCKTCEKEIKQSYGKRKRQFCSDRCHMDWWNARPNKVKRKAFYTFRCAFCGDEFTAYGNANRKYCCHECYINDRYFSRGNV